MICFWTIQESRACLCYDYPTLLQVKHKVPLQHVKLRFHNLSITLINYCEMQSISICMARSFRRCTLHKLYDHAHSNTGNYRVHGIIYIRMTVVIGSAARVLLKDLKVSASGKFSLTVTLPCRPRK